MRAVRLDTRTNSIEVTDVPTPIPTGTQARVKVSFAGICHTDIHFIDGEHAPGMPDLVTLGHEAAGVVDAVGPAVSKVRIGDRVTLLSVLDVDGTPRVTGAHTDGGWAERFVADESQLLPVPASIPFEQAAIISDAVSTAWGAITDAGQVRPAQAVGVWGVGGLGFHAVKELRLVGASPIIGIDPLHGARELALKAGADAALDPNAAGFQDQIMNLTDGNGLDVALELVGHAHAQRQGFDSLRRQGTLVLVGIPKGPLFSLESAEFVRSGKRIVASYSAPRARKEEIVKLISQGWLDLSDSISAIYSLEDATAAVQHLRDKRDTPIRILLEP